MDKINNISGVVSILRTHVSKNLSKKGKSTLSKKGEAANTNKRSGIDVLERRVVERLQKLNSKIGESNENATRAIVESILMWEFGDSILNDPEFELLVTKVITGMETSGKLSELLAEFVGSANSERPE